MTALPTGDYITDPARTVAEIKQADRDILGVIAELLGGAAESTLAIAAGAVTPTAAVHSIDTEGGGATDDLTNIVTTNHPDGRLLLIRCANNARSVVVKHNAGGAGQVALAKAADLVLSDTTQWLLVKRTGANWEEIFHTFKLGAARVDDIAGAAWAQGDVMYAGAGPQLKRLAAGDFGAVLTTFGAGADPIWTSAPVAAGSFKNLLTTFNAISPNTKWDVTCDEIILEGPTGAAIRVQNVNLSNDITTVGANGVDAGSAPAANTGYFKWIIYNPTTGVAATLSSLSATAPTMPAGYTYKARIGWVRTDATGKFWQVIQYGRRAQIVVDGTVLAIFPRLASGSSARVAVSVVNFVPPTASRISVRLSCVAGTGGTIIQAYANTNGGSLIVGANNGGSTSNHDIPGDIVLESTSIAYSATVGAGGGADLYCTGWEDNL